MKIDTTTLVTVKVALILYVLLVILLGVYGYASPDPEHCFYVPGVEQTALTRSGALTLAKE